MATPVDTVRMTRQLALAAGLDLDEARLAALAPRLAKFWEFLGPARAISLGDVEPAHITPLPDE